MKNHTLVTELQKLKESSRYAIAQGGKYDLDDFKKYLHIEREVENRLKHIIVQSSLLNHSQLVVVCGNVGDGKSHILSYLHNEIPTEIGKFQIHNDATESHNPNESSNDTLYRILDSFKDKHIEQSNSKLILAINLGTFSKFMEEHGSEFQKLAVFIQEQSILDNAMVSFKDFDQDSHFHQINFTDYHLYSLTENGPISNIITELLNRIVIPLESNVIYTAYEKIKDQSQFSRCPVKLNYEFLFNFKNRKLIEQLIIQSIAQNKEIVSVRSLLNFIYDLIVPVQLSLATEADQLNTIPNLSDTEFLKCQIPNYIFEHADLSNLFARLTELDPCNVRNDQTDEKLLKLQSIDNPSELFSIDIQPELYNAVLQQIKIERVDKDVISRYFLRLLFFQNGNTSENNDFQEYITWLYHFNKGNPKYLSKLYDLVENAVKKWYGDPKKGDKVVLKLGRRQVKYRVFKDFLLIPQPYIPNETKDLILHQFVQEFIVCYTSPNPTGQDIRIAIDFSLFKTLKMINLGYRPNKKDNNNFIYFVYFINEVTQGNQQNTLYIDEVNVGKPIDYKLTKNPFGGYKFELVS
ncbi:DNA phosphorothioation-dependent restriction protein DptF [Elizabethkingia ursingii]|uniref:DNA phosphorothioation-dependent restriction protein DptF n=1 Tax=Elizabethkingia ursingii TaxID=1756150 RepID=UPI00099A65D0|nr:DNA phosphorothioation-dependent restriction protein DptF [Elizabethkingia ursingii]OPC04838.1 DNA phosphorothioation-dependent restriction protein DptF [Elizabethkingia ursingii]